MTPEENDRDRHHRVELDVEGFGSSMVRFLCDAPEGSACRMLPACQHDGGCRDNEGHHGGDCTEADRILVDTGECVIEPWIEDGDETGRGTITFPVTTSWDGDSWLWTPRGDAK